MIYERDFRMSYQFQPLVEVETKGELHDGQYVTEPPKKLWTPTACVSFLIDNTLHIVTHRCAETVRHPEDNKNFTFGTFPDLALCVFPFGWFWFVSFYYNKTEIKYSVSWVLSVILANLRGEWEPLNLKPTVKKSLFS